MVWCFWHHVNKGVVLPSRLPPHGFRKGLQDYEQRLEIASLATSTSLVPLVKLQSLRNTSLEFGSPGTLRIQPRSDLVVSDFKNGFDVAGVQVWLPGFACRLQEPRHSRNDLAMRPGLLCAPSGTAVRLMLRFQLAQAALQEGHAQFSSFVQLDLSASDFFGHSTWFPESCSL